MHIEVASNFDFYSLLTVDHFSFTFREWINALDLLWPNEFIYRLYFGLEFECMSDSRRLNPHYQSYFRPKYSLEMDYLETISYARAVQ